jgi:hypothetical protein
MVSARRADGTTLTATISRGGSYRIAVLAGNYTLNVRTGSLLPACPQATVAVSVGAAVRADISCDTGIR